MQPTGDLLAKENRNERSKLHSNSFISSDGAAFLAIARTKALREKDNVLNFANYFDTTPGTGCGATDASGQTHTARLDCSSRWVQNYLTSYSGAVFDLALDLDPNTMLASDLYSVGALSMRDFWSPSDITSKLGRFKIDKSLTLACTVQNCQVHFHCVLERVPTTASVYHLSTNAALRTDVDLLWTLIGPLVGVTSNAPASRTKPLARKRPSLIPILDEKGSIADRRAKGNANGTYWDSIIAEMTSSQNSIQAGIAVMRQRGLPQVVSELRVVDILVWMFRTNQQAPCS